MKGLLINEFYSLKTYIFFFTILNIVYAILFIPSQGTPTFIGLAIGISVGLVYRAVIADESTNWALYALITKANRSNYVLSKFILLPIVTFGAAIEAFIIISIYKLFDPAIESAFSPINLLTAEVAFSYLIITGSIILTLVFYFGFDKLMLLLMLILVIPIFLVNLFSSYISLGNINFDQLKWILGLLPFLACFIWYICFRISVRIFEKKDL